MTPIKPEERGKVIGLAAAIAAVAAFGVYQFSGRRGTSTTPTPPSGTVVNGSGAIAAAPTAAAPSGLVPVESMVGMAAPAATVATGPAPRIEFPNPRLDPFRPAVAGSVPAPTASLPLRPAAPPVARPAGGVVVVARPLNYSGAGYAGGSFGGGRRVPSGSGNFLPPAQVTRQEASLELVGVVSAGTPSPDSRASAPIAMIRTGQSQLFVREGERVGSYRVSRIVTDAVTLVRGKTMRVLRVGVPAVGGGASLDVSPAASYVAQQPTEPATLPSDPNEEALQVVARATPSPQMEVAPAPLPSPEPENSGRPVPPIEATPPLVPVPAAPQEPAPPTSAPAVPSPIEPTPPAP